MSTFEQGVLYIVAGIAALTLNDVSEAFFGVPLTALTMAALGAAMSFAYDNTKRSRAKLFVLAAVYTILGASLVSIVPDLFGWQLKPAAQPPLAFIFALFAQKIVPAMRNLVPALATAAANILSRSGYGGQLPPPPSSPPRDDARKRRDDPDDNDGL